MDEDVQHLIWSYKNLKIPMESYTKQEKQIILQYIEQEEAKPSKVKTYSEPMYRNPIKNVVQYNRERPEFVTQEQLEQVAQKEYNYTYKKKQNKPLKQSKIVKKETQPEEEPKLKLEDQIEQQMHFVKSQILNHD